MTVLILAEEYDPSVDRVVLGLADRVPVARVNLAWFPGQLTLDAELSGGLWHGVLQTPERDIVLGDVRSVWFRRPAPFVFPDDMTPAVRAHAEREARYGLGGVLASMPVRWVNHPHRDADAAYKPHQLATAQRCGLDVPRTLITNDPLAVRRFAAHVGGRLVVKVLGSNVLYEDGQRKVAHTHVLTDDDLDQVAQVRVTAHQFQEWVPKRHEVRLVVVGRRLFAAGIHAGSPASEVDWRADYDALTYSTVDVPDEVAAGVHAFMDACGLAFSALDFVVTPDGRWVFLESNSGGQYGWIE
ncbi:ATP-grasp ribosomal peptide maturase [Goodfellowiella coeruleoviolacea]|uniref:ATP-grasp ribosomal peptide maturase, SAV_5884 family n=1 Tax=Goodfellowiella coeruleoviolacea TaxID=334858 RepID=A0AAE3GGV3_9PSEU|nr:ATP-grasp ribosomal peptide maturase [Goodfellowiella coeruleoviolacea]MCP2167054.1 ATP-grasp ribosomal peptide maturase, SAV_5884 family [Goodfellowiella coeruleoviolacea]